MIMLHINLIMFHADIDKWHVNIIKSLKQELSFLSHLEKTAFNRKTRKLRLNANVYKLTS